MQKQPPTLGRVLVMVVFALSCFGLLLFLWLAFGGPIPLKPKGYRFQASFGEASQLATQSDVRISGVRVGKVQKIQTMGDGRSRVTMELDSRYAPLPKDSRAILRQKTLLGETYVELTPGHKRPGNMLPENGTLPIAQVSPTVELDEVFRAFDPQTRQRFRDWFQSMAETVSGRGQDLSDALGNLGPFAESTTTLLALLNAQQANVRGLINDTGTVFDALSARDHQLASLITNSNRVFSTTARRDRDLQALFRVLPTFEAESNTTLRRVFRFAGSANPLVDQLHPAARELSPTLVQLAGLAPDLKALFRDLNPLIDASRTGLPATADFLDELHPLLGELDSPLRQLNPILRFIGFYRTELRSFFANVPAATQACQTEARSKGVCVHYLRVTNPLNPENFAQFPRRIASNRPNAYQLPFGYDTLRTLGLLRSFETRQCDPNRGNPVFNAQALAQDITQQATQNATGAAAQLLQSLPQLPPLPQTPQLRQAGQLPQVPQVPALNTITGLLDSISTLAFAGGTGNVPAPACVPQPTFKGVNGQDLKYPHNAADPSGATRGK